MKKKPNPGLYRVAKYGAHLVPILSARKTRKGWVFSIRAGDGAILRNIPESDLTDPRGIA